MVYVQCLATSSSVSINIRNVTIVAHGRHISCHKNRNIRRLGRLQTLAHGSRATAAGAGSFPMPIYLLHFVLFIYYIKRIQET